MMILLLLRIVLTQAFLEHGTFLWHNRGVEEALGTIRCQLVPIARAISVLDRQIRVDAPPDERMRYRPVFMVQLLDALDQPTLAEGRALAHSIQFHPVPTINDPDRPTLVGAPLLVVAHVDPEKFRLMPRIMTRN